MSSSMKRPPPIITQAGAVDPELLMPPARGVLGRERSVFSMLTEPLDDLRAFFATASESWGAVSTALWCTLVLAIVAATQIGRAHV